MDLFRVLNKIEDGIRRASQPMIEKATEEKMAVPQIMGTGSDRKDLVDNVVSGGEDILDPGKCDEDTSEDSSEEKSLVNFMGFRRAAEQGGVVYGDKPVVEKASMVDGKRPEMSPNKAPKGKMSEMQSRIAENDDKNKGEKKSAKKKAAAKRKAKGGSEKKAKKPSAAPKEKKTSATGKSGKGSGQGGRTGRRTRRGVGDVWMAASGFGGGQKLWTKQESGGIVRLPPEQQTQFKNEMKKRGRDWKSGWDADSESEHWGNMYGKKKPSDGHKTRTEEVQSIKGAAGLDEHLTGKSRIEFIKKLKAFGIELTEDQIKSLARSFEE